MCVYRGVSALARPVPRWQLLADGGFAVGQAGGCALGGASGKAAGRALRWRRIGSGWHAGPSLGLGAFPVWGGCTLDSQRGLRGPCAGRVGSGRLELAGGRGHGRSLTCRGRQRVLSGRACLHLCLCPNLGHVCVCGLLPSWGCRCRSRGRPGALHPVRVSSARRARLGLTAQGCLGRGATDKWSEHTFTLAISTDGQRCPFCVSDLPKAAQKPRVRI